jgi:hypothetical protein
VAAIIAWEASNDAVLAGQGKVQSERSMEVLVCG